VGALLPLRRGEKIKTGKSRREKWYKHGRGGRGGPKSKKAAAYKKQATKCEDRGRNTGEKRVRVKT